MVEFWGGEADIDAGENDTVACDGVCDEKRKVSRLRSFSCVDCATVARRKATGVAVAMRKTLAGAVVGGGREEGGGNGVYVVARPWRWSLVKAG